MKIAKHIVERSVSDNELRLSDAEGILHPPNALVAGAGSRPIHHEGDAMKKLKLNAEAIAVESFQTGTQAMELEFEATCRCSKCVCTYTCPLDIDVA